LDKPAIHAAEDFVHAGFRSSRGHCDHRARGPGVEVDECRPRRAIAQGCWAPTCCPDFHFRDESNLFWSRPQGGIPARWEDFARSICMDGTIRSGPCQGDGAHRERWKLRLRRSQCFHAAEGNLHPLTVYDANKPGEMEGPEALAPTSRVCVETWRCPIRRTWRLESRSATLMPEMFSEIDLNSSSG